jgi:hypothetical protein
MPDAYRKTASKRKRKLEHYPELPLAAQIAGVTYWMAYKVRKGEAKSKKVEIAIKLARKELRQQKAAERKRIAEENRAAREQKKAARQLEVEQRKTERTVAKGRAA